MKKTWLITGSTSIIAQQFAHIAAQNGCDLILVGRNTQEMVTIASDLRLRYKIHCEVETVNMNNDIQPFCNKLVQFPKDISLFIAHSLIVENPDLNLQTIDSMLAINVSKTAQIIHDYLSKPQKEHELIFLSSVAASRGKARNSLYGASKAAIEVYLEGLQQHASPNQHITIARLGFIDTIQTYGKAGIFYASPPEACAKACWNACAKRKRLIYHPFFWRYIMGMIKRVPFFIYKRMKDM